MSERSPTDAAEVGRALLGLTYLVGGLVHLWFWWGSRGLYAELTPQIRFGWYRDLWTGLVLPNLGVLLPGLAAFEFALAGLLWSRDGWTRVGNGLGIAFQVAIAPLGPWWPTNVLLAFGHALLARQEFRESTVSVIRRRR